MRFLLLALPLLVATEVADTSARGPGSLRQAVLDAGLRYPPPNVSIRIDKSDRQLMLYSGKTLLKTYSMGIGGHDRDKVRRGDLATPDGDFRIVTRGAGGSYHKFMGISYPLPEDADRGLASGLINKAQAAEIKALNAEGKPAWSTRLGGAIGIHGGGGDSDWTLGCIAVHDHEADEIWFVTRMGTPVSIRR